jgi:hypothetical protein
MLGSYENPVLDNLKPARPVETCLDLCVIYKITLLAGLCLFFVQNRSSSPVRLEEEGKIFL